MQSAARDLIIAKKEKEKENEKDDDSDQKDDDDDDVENEEEKEVETDEEAEAAFENGVEGASFLFLHDSRLRYCANDKSTDFSY